MYLARRIVKVVAALLLGVVSTASHVEASPRVYGDVRPFGLDPAAALNASVASPLSVSAFNRSSVEAVDGAVRILQPYVLTSHPEALRYAIRAYSRFRAAHPELVRKPYLYFVDFGLDSNTPRGYVFDMDAIAIVAGPFAVAHGRGSALEGEDLPTRFVNAKNSKATSLGLYLAEETYSFLGHSGSQTYRSIGLRLDGMSGRFNSNARERGIVVHGAPYVTPMSAGRSEGCPAMEPSLAQNLIPRIANGGVVFHFSPHDPNWLREDPWAGVITPVLASAN